MKKVVVGIVLLVVLSFITVWVVRQNSASTMRSELTDFAVEDTLSITKIILKDEQGERIELQREDGFWTLNQSYLARPDAVKILLTTMKKVRVRAPVSQQMMNTVLKTIIANHTLVEAYAGNTLVKSYYVGSPDRDHTGTFMMISGSERPFVTHIEGFHGFLTPRYFTNLNEWRHRGIFEYERDEIAALDLRINNGSQTNISIVQNTDGVFDVYTGSDDAPVSDLDTFMLNAYLSHYKKVHFEGIEETKTDAFIDSVKQSEPIFTISLTDTEGHTREVIGFKKPLKNGFDPEGNPLKFDFDRLYLWIDSGEMVVGQYAIFDPLTKGLGFLPSR